MNYKQYFVSENNITDNNENYNKLINEYIKEPGQYVEDLELSILSTIINISIIILTDE